MTRLAQVRIMCPTPVQHNQLRREVTSSLQDIRILVVDPDHDTRALHRQSFLLNASEVVEVADGREALVAALAHPPDPIVTETNLPFLDGFALCRLLRHDPVTAHVPILVVTADTRPATVERVQAAGASAYS